MPTLPRTARRALARASAAGFALALGGTALLVAATPAAAAGTVTVSQTTGLDPAGTAVQVTGSGFSETQGIYVSVCVDNGPGVLPTPCLGGIDTTGSSSSSGWISSNPPPYAEGLTTPYGPGGSFDIELYVVGSYQNDEVDPPVDIDCMVVQCSLVTRSDHTATDDRSQDTRTPLTFVAGGAAPTEPTDPAEQPTTPATPDATDGPSLATDPAETSTPAESTTPADQPTEDASPVSAPDGTDDDAGGLPAVAIAGIGGGVALLGAGGVLLALRSRRSSPPTS